MSFVSLFWRLSFTTVLLFNAHSLAFTGSEYRLDAEYSGTNFFDGWDFYSDRDPTGGTVTYYSRSSAELTGLISTSEDGPAYMGANYVDTLPFDNNTGSVSGAGRPSIRIASKQAWTHGLFIGDFQHIPAGVCGTWPAFWTLGPNWPYTGEIDILEGVNLNSGNVMSLHTNETCTIVGDSSMMTGDLGNTNCAYYPDYNVGCGVSDPSPASYSDFNVAGGGVYAMQWTSEYIRIWQWSRDQIPSDIDNKTPDPSSWGLPTAQLGVGNCTIDQHFQDHKVIFDLTFCGAYAGLPSVWNSNDNSSCAAKTGLSTCDNYVANNPQAFENAYWSVNYVRVYQLVNPDAATTATPYIASEQPTRTISAVPNFVATPNINAEFLCPHYNYTIITDGKYDYEIACDVDVPGPDIIGNPYDGFHANSLTDCLKGCSYMNDNNGTNSCGGVIHYASINFCYFKKYFDQPGVYRPGYNEVRLIYYGYPQITDDVASQYADSTATTTFIETIPTPQTYLGTFSPITTTVSTYLVSSSTSSQTTTVGAPAMGINSTSATTASGVGPDYSQTVTDGYNSTLIASSVGSDYTQTVTQDYASTTSSTYHTVTESYSTTTSMVSQAPQPTTSTSPTAVDASFYISFEVSGTSKFLSKRALQYLSLDQSGQSTLVTSESEATKFQLDADGDLVTSGSTSQYVSINTDVQPPRFSLQSTKPDNPVVVNVSGDGSVSFAGVQSYCLTSNATLAIVTPDSDKPDDCQTVVAELVSTPGNSTTTSSSTGGRSTSSSTTTESTSSYTTTVASTPTVKLINDFVYAGCFGIPETFAPIAGISAPYSNSSMTNELCTSYCKSSTSIAYFAATYNDTCFCASTTDLYPSLINYPDPACNIPCPGANREMCGGNSTTAAGARSLKRQTAQLLISLYNNTDLLPQPGQSNSPTTVSSPSPTSASTSTITTASTSTSSTTGVANGIGGIITSAANTNTALGNGMIPTSFPASEVSYDITGTNTATVLGTTYVDVCGICHGGVTTLATTITVPHCGCTASFDKALQTVIPVPSPTIPMTTTVKNCACGARGAQSSTTLTLPHEASITQLVNAVPLSGTTPITMTAPASLAAATPAPAAVTPSDAGAGVSSPNNNPSSAANNPGAPAPNTPTSVPATKNASTPPPSPMPKPFKGEIAVESSCPAIPMPTAVAPAAAAAATSNGGQQMQGSDSNSTLSAIAPLGIATYVSSASGLKLEFVKLAPVRGRTWSALLLAMRMRYVLSSLGLGALTACALGLW